MFLVASFTELKFAVPMFMFVRLCAFYPYVYNNTVQQQRAVGDSMLYNTMQNINK